MASEWGPQPRHSSCHPHRHIVPSAAASTAPTVSPELCTFPVTVVTTGQLCGWASNKGFHTPNMVSTTN